MNVELELHWAGEILASGHFVNSDGFDVGEAHIEETVRSFHISNGAFITCGEVESGNPIMTIIVDVDRVSIFKRDCVIEMETPLHHKGDRGKAFHLMPVALGHELLTLNQDVIVVVLAPCYMEVVVGLLIEVEDGVVSSVREHLGPEELEIICLDRVLVESYHRLILLIQPKHWWCLKLTVISNVVSDVGT